MPLSQTSQPRPQAPSVGFSQSSSTNRMSLLLQIQAQRLQRAQIQIQDIGRRRLHHHLVLVIVLQPIRVVAIPTVLGPPTGLHVGGLPGLGSDGTQKSCCMRGAGTHFHVIGLHQHTTLRVPVGLQLQDDLLESQHGISARVLAPCRRDRRTCAPMTRLGRARRFAQRSSTRTATGRLILRGIAATSAPRQPLPRPRPATQAATRATSRTRRHPPRIRRDAVATLDLACKNTTDVARQRVGHPAGVVDDGRVAGIRCTDERAIELQRAHARDVQVLVDRHRIAKPADVADVDKDGRRLGRIGESLPQFFTEQVFVTDVGRQTLALPLERRLADRTPTRSRPAGYSSWP